MSSLSLSHIVVLLATVLVRVSADRGALRCVPDLDNFHAYGARTEIVCSGCASHLGHVFFEGAKGADERHCVNSLAIRHHDHDASEQLVQASEGEDAGQREQSLRTEHEACMQLGLQMLMGGT